MQKKKCSTNKILELNMLLTVGFFWAILASFILYVYLWLSQFLQDYLVRIVGLYDISYMS